MGVFAATLSMIVPNPYSLLRAASPPEPQLSLDTQIDALWDQFETQQAALGHGHSEVLKLEEQLARAHHLRGERDLARDLFEEALVYRSVLEGYQGRHTVVVAAGLFELLCEVGDRSAMAEVYYRYLSWLTMRSPHNLDPTLLAIHVRVEELI